MCRKDRIFKIRGGMSSPLSLDTKAGPHWNSLEGFILSKADVFPRDRILYLGRFCCTHCAQRHLMRNGCTYFCLPRPLPVPWSRSPCHVAAARASASAPTAAKGTAGTAVDARPALPARHVSRSSHASARERAAHRRAPGRPQPSGRVRAQARPRPRRRIACARAGGARPAGGAWRREEAGQGWRGRCLAETCENVSC